MKARLLTGGVYRETQREPAWRSELWDGPDSRKGARRATGEARLLGVGARVVRTAVGSRGSLEEANFKKGHLLMSQHTAGGY